MPSLRLPLWFVTERRRKEPLANTPCNDPHSVLAFTDTGTLAEFLRTGKAGRWKVDLVSEPLDMVLAIADYHQKGVVNVCVNPEPDGSGGEFMSLADLMQFSQEPKL